MKALIVNLLERRTQLGRGRGRRGACWWSVTGGDVQRHPSTIRVASGQNLRFAHELCNSSYFPNKARSVEVHDQTELGPEPETGAAPDFTHPCHLQCDRAWPEQPTF